MWPPTDLPGEASAGFRAGTLVRLGHGGGDGSRRPAACEMRDSPSDSGSEGCDLDRSRHVSPAGAASRSSIHPAPAGPIVEGQVDGPGPDRIRRHRCLSRDVSSSATGPSAEAGSASHTPPDPLVTREIRKRNRRRCVLSPPMTVNREVVGTPRPGMDADRPWHPRRRASTPPELELHLPDFATDL